MRGGADDSYGIEVARLAGVPQPVIDKAKQVLQGLESGAGTAAPPHRDSAPAENPPRRGGEPSRLLEALSHIDVTTLTPIEAINKLYELKSLSEELSDRQDGGQS